MLHRWSHVIHLFCYLHGERMMEKRRRWQNVCLYWAELALNLLQGSSVPYLMPVYIELLTQENLWYHCMCPSILNVPERDGNVRTLVARGFQEAMRCGLVSRWGNNTHRALLTYWELVLGQTEISNNELMLFRNESLMGVIKVGYLIKIMTHLE